MKNNQFVLSLAQRQHQRGQQPGPRPRPHHGRWIRQHNALPIRRGKVTSRRQERQTEQDPEIQVALIISFLLSDPHRKQPFPD